MNLFTASLEYGTHRGNKTLKVKGFLGRNIEAGIYFYLKRKTHNLLISLYKDEIEIYAFFTLELYMIFYKLVNDKSEFGFKKPLNKKALNDALIQMRHLPEMKNLTYPGKPQDELSGLEERAKNVLDFSQIKRHMNFGILPHQEVIFRDYSYVKALGIINGRSMSADPGTGKTFSSLALSLALKSDIVIILAPKSILEDVWVEALTGEMFKRPQKYWLCTGKAPYMGEKYIIANYAYIGKLENILPKDSSKICIIVDESHNLNEKGTKRDREMESLVRGYKPADVLLLSGTSIKGSTMEVSNILKYVDRRFTKEVEAVFEALYKSPNDFLVKTLPVRFKYVETYVSKDSLKLEPPVTIEEVVDLPNVKYYTLEEIKKRMEKYGREQLAHYTKNMDKYMTRYNELLNESLNKAQDMKLCTKAEISQYFDDFELIRKLYESGGLRDIPHVIRRVNKFEKDNVEIFLKGEVLKEWRSILPIIKYVSMKIQGEILAHVVMRTRIDLSKDFAKHLDYKKILTMTKKKVVIFSAYGEACDVAANHAEKLGKVARVYWHHLADINVNMPKFKNDPDYKSLVATYASIREGAELQVANLTVFLDLPFKTYAYSQAIARTHRYGQDSTCYLMQLLIDTGNEPNINSRNIDIIEMSKEIVEYITERTVDFEFKRTDNDEGKSDGDDLKQANEACLMYYGDESLVPLMLEEKVEHKKKKKRAIF